eukprot:229712_1
MLHNGRESINSRRTTLAEGYTNDKLEWLDNLLQYNLMWVTRNKNGKLRHSIINTIGITSTLSVFSVWAYFEFQDDFYGNDWIHYMVDLVKLACQFIARMISVYYFSFCFNNINLLRYSIYSGSVNRYHNHDNGEIQQVSNRLKIIFSLSTIG